MTRLRIDFTLSTERLIAEGEGEDGLDLEQDVVDELGRDVGVSYHDREELRCGEKEAARDSHRWELDPASAEDYCERSQRNANGPGEPLLSMTHAGHKPRRVCW